MDIRPTRSIGATFMSGATERIAYWYKMTRIHSHSRGKSQSFRPTSRTTPSWLTYSPDELTALIMKLSKEGLGPSLIGLSLRDQYSIPSVRGILGKSLNSILKENNLEMATPEDLDHLVRRAAILHNHLRTHHGDRKNVRSLELLEAKIHRLSKYYKREGTIPDSWKYSAVVAQLT
ncbi:MAG: 30S ribosomal protein S15 [Nitrososphaerales archaeon]